MGGWPTTLKTFGHSRQINKKGILVCSVRNVCPRGHQALVPPSGGGCYCLLCSYEEVEDPLSLYSELLANAPGIPLPTRVERYDERVQRGASDAALAREAAKRYGVSLEDLRRRMHWKTTPLPTRAALQSAIYDLTVAGLDVQRVADALGKSPRTINKSPGLARGRARRRAG